MAIELDHLIVSAKDPRAAARRLGELLAVPWSETGLGPFSPVYLNDGLTIDFIADPDDFPVQHLCFRVDDASFDAILARLQLAGIPYRSTVRGPQDMAVSTAFGGRGVYWNDPERHQWEMLTVSYARRSGPG
jgi:catechol 2,3-dioxygenase-like lactoylglutathione lyase family enzyme